MSHYTKDRNIITISIDGVTGNYRLDLSTGIFYGVRGKQIATYTNKESFKRAFVDNRNTSNLARVLYTMFDRSRGKTSAFTDFLSAMNGAERMDAINSPTLSWHRLDYYAFINEHFDDFVKFLREHEGAEEVDYSDFSTFLTLKEITKNAGNIISLFSSDMIKAVVRYFGTELTAKDWDFFAYYLVRGKYYQYHNGNLTNLYDYVETCKAMEKEPQKVNNFMREYVETKNEYQQKKTEYDNNRLCNNYAKHANAFNFTFGEYTVVLPTCGQDIVDEGQNMHHCVGSYVSRVVENSTYIVFVRKTDTPDECYLTCQVSTEGEICQYYLAYDRRITSAEDIAFREAFQNHLKENW